jgi:hypothetical protein
MPDDEPPELVEPPELDELYLVKPQDFTATRSRLAAGAKERGDAKSAKQISASRKPTMAAWVVNSLALSRQNATNRLTQLGERLRAAHAAMDGDQIRELSAQQRSLIDELATAAFGQAEIPDPSAALREDVTGTLQAAIADPDVAARLGRLARAERWSGFGDFGVTAPVSAAAKPAKKTPPPQPQKPVPQREKARHALAEAQRAKAQADAAQDDRHTELVSARWRRQEARKQLDAAEHDLRAAEHALARAEQTSRDAADLVKEARAQLNRT